MNTVGKLGRYISQSVYTVSGPFHPFGGAVDIVVVQQQDGSFKSSPWYVRFGKFQGVLKSKENVVKISVNGVEAGFSMYLDNKGEAFFIRELEAGEGRFILTTPALQDEMEGPKETGQFEKMQSFDVEGGRGGRDIQEDADNDKILRKTSSRRSLIFGLVFGRKSTKKNDEGENMERVTSMERAEIAADLLEMKWSTNLTSSGQGADNDQENTFQNSMTNVCVADEEHPQAPSSNEGFGYGDNLNLHGERMDDNFTRGFSSKNCCQEERDEDLSCLSVSKTTIDIDETANSDKANSDKKNSEITIGNRNLVIDPQIFDLDIDEMGLGNTLMKNDATEKNFDEETFHVKMCTSETGDSKSTSKFITEFTAVQPNETNCQNTGLAACHDDKRQSYTESCAGSTSGIPTCENDINEIVSFSNCETIELSTIMFNTSDENFSDSSGLKHSKDELCNVSSMISDITSLSELVSSSGKEVLEGCLNQKQETSISNEFFVSEESQYPSLRNRSLVDSDKNVLNIKSDLNSRLEQIPSDISCLSNQWLLSYDQKFISTDTRAKESAHEDEKQVQQIDFLRHLSDFEGREASQIPYFPVYISSDKLTFGTAAESYGVFEIPNSCNSINAAQNFETVGSDTNMKKSYSLEGVNVGDIGAISMPTEVAKCSLEDVQFPSSDIDNAGAKEIDTEIASNTKVAEADQVTDTAEDVGEHDFQIKKYKQCPSRKSDDICFNSSGIDIPGCKISSGETELSSRSLPFMSSHTKDMEGYNLHHPLCCSLNSVGDIYGMGALKHEDSISSKLGAEPQTEVAEGHTSGFTGSDISADNNEEQKGPMKSAIVGVISVDGAERRIDSSGNLRPSQGSWNLWPFLKRSKTTTNAQATSEDRKEMHSRSVSNISLESNMQETKNSKMVQSLTPTSEELASLNLKEGQNLVKFSFLTPMLGLQQVDARIYLWKWNTRIVVSDVDGTITKSDVLGQFMPLVGIDWSQTGVTHLFSAIKDNGYQLLFLSARSISQAHLTRQFLFNLKQDGKAMPDGPVFISPDGLFPSLYREVIRRAPHEFKISCLEAVKALFPPDCNPFYAGFGNRDTDEISYLKVGIPLGKIFIINPKGQIIVNRQVDTRSYASLHDLVNGIFPPTSSSEQEEYNSWNYWKLPLPNVKN
ncbi:phosphatidate phosphatase PAH2-like isoform X3 [Canna indica]|uniref:Phosphatidate phosphatase PAH2-like isoform X3 n=1 Tax=Canna indica TaxID=4628 RepID=A0AAQ3JWW5_9LILI|nr:phosphatidate phosphatase PAH2-like isoform X3 [Canna indica]